MVSDRVTFDGNPFRLNWAAPHPALQTPADIVAKSLEHLLQLSQLNRIYSALKITDDSRYFPARVLELLGVQAEIQTTDLTTIPRQGPVVVVANHPFGVLEGLLLMRLLHAIRPDTRVLLNSILARVPECHDFGIFVNPFGGPSAVSANRTGMKSALRWLKTGGLLLVFPAGEVARMNWNAGRISDPPWNDNIARLIRTTRAGVVPVHIDGANSHLFQIAGLVHPRLQTALLPQELLNKRNSTSQVQMGRFIAADRLELFPSDSALIRYLRLRVDTLACRHPLKSVSSSTSPRFPDGLPLFRNAATPEPIAPPADRIALCADIAALDDEHTLLTHGALRVICAYAHQLPALLPELGRLRELTFRKVGEGTGRARDLDAFDAHYLHLFLWNDETAEVVGAYRMGPTDRILAQSGVRGLYTSTLFNFRQPLLDHLTPALELGRSFVRPEYQRGYLPLLLLWKGVAHYVARHPHYRKLFGPVSISNSYHPVSRHLIQHHFPRAPQTPQLAAWVCPRKSLHTSRHLRLPQLPVEWSNNLSILTDLIEDLENGKSLPVLLRQYLKLGGEVIAFNLDPAFNSTLDALIVVDLEKAGEAALGRYMGAENWARFMNRAPRLVPTLASGKEGATLQQ